MRSKIKSFLRRARHDANLIFKSPKPFFESRANENYWNIRKKNTESGLNAYQRDRFDWIIGRIGTPSGTLLDVGSGNGEMLVAFRSSGLQCVGSDFSDISCDRLRKSGFEALQINLNDSANLSLLPESDYIVICEVLEHLPDPENTLLILRSKASKALFFSVPNTGYYTYRLRLLFGRFPVQWRAHPGEHVRFWTLGDMHWWLRELGLSDHSIVKTYQCLPIVGRLFPGLFAPAMIVEIKAEPKEVQ